MFTLLWVLNDFILHELVYNRNKNWATKHFTSESRSILPMQKPQGAPFAFYFILNFAVLSAIVSNVFARGARRNARLARICTCTFIVWGNLLALSEGNRAWTHRVLRGYSLKCVGHTLVSSFVQRVHHVESPARWACCITIDRKNDVRGAPACACIANQNPVIGIESTYVLK